MNQKLAKALRKYVRDNARAPLPTEDYVGDHRFVRWGRVYLAGTIRNAPGTLRAAYLRLKKLPPALLRTVV